MDVVGLGAWCDVVPDDEQGLPRQDYEGTASCRVSELAVLADGSRLTLHDERGFSWRTSSGEDPWRHVTLAAIEADVLTTVLPDDADGADADQHPWAWLAELLRAHGVEVSVARLRTLPYVIECSERLLARLAAPD